MIMVKKVMLLIQETVLGGKILKTLVQNDIDFVEAKNEQDVLFKLDIFMKVSLIIMNHSEALVSLKIARRLRNTPRFRDVKILIILQKGNKSLIDLAHKEMINDLMLLPFEDKVLMNKITSLIEDKAGDNSVYKDLLPNNRECNRECMSIPPVLKREIKAAGRGKYFLSAILAQCDKIEGKQWKQFIGLMEKTLRETDTVVPYMDTVFLLLLPFTGERGLPTVESKIRDIFNSITGDGSFFRLHLYGICVKEGDTPEAFMERLKQGIHSSMMIDKLGANIVYPKNDKVRIQRNFYSYNVNRDLMKIKDSGIKDI